MIARESNWTCPRRIIAVSLLAASALTALAVSAFSDIGKIAFTSIRDGKPAIYIMNSDGTNPVKLANGSHPSWSPDGEKIVFMSNRNGQRNIYVMDADGTKAVNLTPDLDFAYSPVWSPDGEKIVFGTEGDIFVMDARGANRINLTQNPRAVNMTPSWSPDGRKIAYSASPKPGLWFAPFNIYLMNADGTHPVMLTKEWRWAYEYSPSWSSDGSRIAFQRREPDGTYDIYAIKIDGSGAANLTRTPRVEDYSPSWRPSGLSVPRTDRLTTSWGALKQIQ